MFTYFDDTLHQTISTNSNWCSSPTTFLGLAGRLHQPTTLGDVLSAPLDWSVVLWGAGDWYTIYHQLPVVGETNPSIEQNQPMGIWDIYDDNYLLWLIMVTRNQMSMPIIYFPTTVYTDYITTAYFY